jgi:diphthine synthase
MTFYLIGLGLDKKSISADALEVLPKCSKIYLEDYTVNFPYKIEELEKALNVKIIQLSRQVVENESFLKDAKKENVALLVYGDSLSATTHTQLIISCKSQNIPFKVFHNSSIMTAIACTGLQLYKFGKTTSMPNWKEHTNKPTSLTDYIKENQSINAHSLILTDIGLELKDALHQLSESKINCEKLIVISNAGTEKQRIFFDSPEKLSKIDVKMPFCLVIPSKMNFFEEEAVKKLTN